MRQSYDVVWVALLFVLLDLAMGLPVLAPWWWALLAFDIGAVIGIAGDRREGGAL